MIDRARSVLVVDDDESMRLLLASELTRLGHHVACAADGDDAISTLRVTTPDLLILDLLMPGTTGWDVLEFVDESPRLSDMPVVVLTAFGDCEEAPAGCTVIHKPLEADLLGDLVDELLANAMPRHRGAGPTSA
jgi:OmpR family response regulator RpaB